MTTRWNQDDIIIHVFSSDDAPLNADGVRAATESACDNWNQAADDVGAAAPVLNVTHDLLGGGDKPLPQDQRSEVGFVDGGTWDMATGFSSDLARAIPTTGDDGAIVEADLYLNPNGAWDELIDPENVITFAIGRGLGVENILTMKMGDQVLIADQSKDELVTIYGSRDGSTPPAPLGGCSAAPSPSLLGLLALLALAARFRR